MVQLPNQKNFTTAAGPVWRVTFTIPADITGMAWEFVIRINAEDQSEPPLVRVTETSSTQGQIAANVTASTVQVTLTPAATRPLGKGIWAHALYSDANTDNEIGWVAGTFTTQAIAAP